MAFTQAQLDALDASIATGALAVEFEGRRVTYRNMAELMQARKIVADGVAAPDPTTGSRVSLATFTKD